MKTPRYVDFKAVKAAVSIRQVLERYGHAESLQERGDRISGPCPICSGGSGTSFRASVEKNCFKCFRCDAGGNVLDLVAALEDCSVRDAALSLAEWFGIPGDKSAGRNPRTQKAAAAKPPAGPKPDPDPPPPAEAPTEPVEAAVPDEREAALPAGQPKPNPPLTFELKLDPDHPWFAEAGLSPETVREFGLGHCAKGMMAGRIAFPLRDFEGRLVGYAGRWPGEMSPDGKPLWKFPKELDLDQVVFPRLPGGEATAGFLLAPDPLRALEASETGLKSAVWMPGATRKPVGGF